MPDSDATLKLLIQLGVLGKEDAEAVLKLEQDIVAQSGKSQDVDKAAAITKKDLKDESSKLGVTTDELGKSIKHAGAESETFTFHGRALHKAIHELNTISPVLGLALRAAIHPAGIGIFAAIAAFEALHKTLEGIGETAHALREIGLAEAFGAPAEWDAAKSSYSEIAESLERIAKAKPSIKDATDATIAQQKEELASLEAIAKAEKKARNARLGITGDEGDESSKSGETKMELAARQKELAATGAADAHAPFALADAGAAKAKADAAVGNLQKEMADLEEKIKVREAARGKLGGQAAEDNEGIITHERQRLFQLQGQMPDALADQKRATEAYNEAGKNAEELAKRLKELDIIIAQLTARLALQQKTEFTIQGITDLAKNRKSDAGDFQHVVQAQQIAAAAATVQKAHQEKDQFILDAFADMAAHAENTQRDLAAISARLAALRNHTGG